MRPRKKRRERCALELFLRASYDDDVASCPPGDDDSDASETTAPNEAEGDDGEDDEADDGGDDDDGEGGEDSDGGDD